MMQTLRGVIAGLVLMLVFLMAPAGAQTESASKSGQSVQKEANPVGAMAMKNIGRICRAWALENGV